MTHATEALSWSRVEHPSIPLGAGWIEIELHRTPCNEIGSASLDALEHCVAWLGDQHTWARAIVVHSSIAAGFCAGADLRELYERMRLVPAEARAASVRPFLERIHSAFAAFERAPMPAIAAVHGVTFGGGFELALACDLIVADRTARFAFPELRLGLIPGFGGIPRLKRRVGVGVVQDLLLTGRSISAGKALEAGIIGQLAAPGEALALARGLARQIAKLDPETVAASKRFVKAPIGDDEVRAEIDLFSALCARPAVEAALEQFVANSSLQPYLP